MPLRKQEWTLASKSRVWGNGAHRPGGCDGKGHTLRAALPLSTAMMMASYVLFFTCSVSSLSSSARVKMAPDSGLISSQPAASLQIRYLGRHKLCLRRVHWTAPRWRRLRVLSAHRSHRQPSMTTHVPFESQTSRSFTQKCFSVLAPKNRGIFFHDDDLISGNRTWISYSYLIYGTYLNFPFPQNCPPEHPCPDSGSIHAWHLDVMFP